MKNLLLQLTIASFLALPFAACSDEGGDSARAGGGKAVVRFDASGISDGGTDARSVNAEGGAVTVHTVSLGDNLYMTATLQEDAGSNTRATPVPLNPGAAYRVVAYNASTGAYVDHADYVKGDTSPYVTLDDGDTYYFLAYSFNAKAAGNPLPAADTSTPLATAKLAAVPAGTDLLYWRKGPVTIAQGENTETITFKHRFSRVNVKMDASLMGASFSAIGAITLKPSYGTVMAFDASGTLSKYGAATTASVAAGFLGGQTSNSAYATIYTAGEDITVGFASFTMGGNAYSAKEATFSATLAPGKNYTLTAKFQGFASLPPGTGVLSGRRCLDVRRNGGTNRGTLTARNTEFTAMGLTDPASYQTQTYTFTPTSTVSNVRFAYVNTNGDPVTAISGGNNANGIIVPVTATVTFRTDLVAAATLKKRPDTGALQPLSADIYAIYKESADGTGSDVASKLTFVAVDQGCCGAKTSADWLVFMCHNRGADYTADPFVPAKALNGNYYQWGRAAVVANANTPAGAIDGWNTSIAPENAWLDGTKTTNDPCPSGWRVPTNAQWQNVVGNNTSTGYGSFVFDAGNFTSGRNLGGSLYLPAAGYRYDNDGGTLGNRGSGGYYWSSTPYGSGSGCGLYLRSSGADMGYDARTYGFSVRCVSE